MDKQINLLGEPIKKRHNEDRGIVSKHLRKKILERDNYRCRMCLSTEDIEIHELTPQSLGGKLSFDNCFTLCYKCHRHMHNAKYFKLLNKQSTKEGLRKAKNVGKRGKDKRPRKRDGYLRYWANRKKNVH